MIDLHDIDPALHDGVTALAAEMRVNGYQRHEPVREIFGLIGDKWTTLILLSLRIGVWRHAELRRVLGRLGAEEGISQRMLTLKLRALERHGVVTRTVTADIPPKVSYALTPVGASLTEEAPRLIDWVKDHRDAIDTARQAFDARDDERGW